SRPLFEDLLREMEDCYDKVVLYAPSLSSGVDASVIASKANENLLIVDSEKCTRRMAVEAVKSFDRLQVRLGGIILTKVKMKKFQRKQMAVKTAEEMRVRERKVKKAKPGAPGKEDLPETVTGRAEKEAEQVSPPAGRPLPVRPRKPALGPRTEPGKTEAEKELQSMRKAISEDFHRLGEAGAPIPRQWLKALNSEKPDISESARIAVSSYYDAFLRKYSISEDSIKNISGSIISMMRREGEFASMTEEEAQRHLQQMLVDAGARFSTAKEKQGKRTYIKQRESTGAGEGQTKERKTGRKESKEFKTKGGGQGDEDKNGLDRTSQLPEAQPQPEEEGGIDWE
ncbi:MAG: hypothetical protein ACOC78_00785, partial [Actinomycetota bacterium]